ncbi:MAG: hypothetical protein ABI358_10060 [Ginsengibacter sp.]
MAIIPSVANTVYGIIYDTNNDPLSSVTVEAFDKDLRSEQLLGFSTTDAKGAYSITYTDQQYASREFKTADIFIKVYKEMSTITVGKTLLGQSDINFNVPKNFTLHFKVDNTPIIPQSEFDVLFQAVNPIIEWSKIAFVDLQENDQFKDFSFLSGETGQDEAHIAFLPVAYQLSAKAKIAADIFYGLFRLQFPTDLNSLQQITSAKITSGINAAISQNIISVRWAGQIAEIVKKLQPS